MQPPRVTLPTGDTRVTYPDGATTSDGTVLHVERMSDGRSAVILDVTAFHPIDTAWPDQPADRGTLTSAHGTQPIVDAVTGGIHDGTLHLGADLPVRTGTGGWVFVVAHIIDGTPPEVGDQVRVDVDEDYRAALSAAHTACHLAALALDAALVDAWTKPAPTDALGHPAFDALAIQQSRIFPHRSIDTYRIGKSLRRKGFTAAALDDLGSVAARVDDQLAAWLAVGGAVRIARGDDGLSSRRTWICELPEGVTDIPCGGTHISDIAELSGITTSLTADQADGGLELTMHTSAHMALSPGEGFEPANVHLEARLAPRSGSVAAKAARTVLSIAAGLLTNDMESGPSGLELVISRRGSGKEVLRLVAGTPQEADVLLQAARRDLAGMSVLDFVSEWRPGPHAPES